MPHALLIVPPTGLYVRADRCQSSVADFAVAFPRPPLDLALAAAYLRRGGARVTARDLPIRGLGPEDFRRDLLLHRPELVLVRTCASTLRQDLACCADARRILPGALVALRAHDLPTALVEERADALDLLVLGEEPAALEGLVRGDAWDELPGLVFRRGGRATSGPAPIPPDPLDGSPEPDWSPFDDGDYRRPDTGDPCALVEVSRGCAGGCTFCLAGPLHGRKVRCKSPERIVREAQARRREGIRDFHLASDCFTARRDWVLALCRLWRAELPDCRWFCNARCDQVDDELLGTMAGAGCFAVALGIESGHEETLRRTGKGIDRHEARRAVALCRRHGLLVTTHFLVGFPWEDEGAIRRSLDFAVECDGDLLDVYFPHPFPGTPLEREARAEGWIDEAATEGAYARPHLRGSGLSASRLEALRRRGLLRFYLRPRLWWRHLLRVRSLADLLRRAGQAIDLLRRLCRATSDPAGVRKAGGTSSPSGTPGSAPPAGRSS